MWGQDGLPLKTTKSYYHEEFVKKYSRIKKIR
jgi:hypothetical protein